MASKTYPLRVRKWGTSLVLTLPPQFLATMNIKRNDYVVLRPSPPYAVMVVWPNVEVPKLEDIPKQDRPPRDPREVLDARASQREEV